MNNELKNIEIKNKILDSREVAEMMGKKHGDLLKDIQGSGRNLGIIPTLTKGNFPVVNYFIESSYKDAKGETRKCYLVTKMGCEMLGNKLQGEKGILFTAKYVERFNQMEEQIKNNKPQISEKDRLLLNLFSNDPIVVSSSHKKLVELEVKEATTPLLETIEEQKPKAEFYDDVAGSSDAIAMGEVAKVLKIKGYGRNNLFEFLRNKKVLQRNNQPYQKYIDLGYFRVVETKFNKPNGDIGINIKTLVYQKGLEYIRKLVLKEVGEN